MRWAYRKLSRLGAALGNWNDRQFGSLARRSHLRTWKTLDRVAAWLYVLGDKS